MKCFTIRKNPDSASDAPYILEYVSSVGKVSGPIESVKTADGQTYAMTPHETQPWYSPNDGYGPTRLVLKPYNTGDDKYIFTAPILSAVTVTGETILTGLHDVEDKLGKKFGDVKDPAAAGPVVTQGGWSFTGNVKGKERRPD